MDAEFYINASFWIVMFLVGWLIGGRRNDKV